MQPLDSLDFVKLVRTGDDNPNQYVSMIMVTCHSEHNKDNQARDAGINEILNKLISARTLFARNRTVIEHPGPLSKHGPILARIAVRRKINNLKPMSTRCSTSPNP